MRLLLAARPIATADHQVEIAAEDHEARVWAERRSHQIIAVAADREWRTKGAWERPNLRSWITDPAKISMYDGIVAAKQDRLSRPRWRDEAEIRWWAEEHRRELFIVSPELHWPPREMAEQIAWEFEAARSRAEREIVSSLQQHTPPYMSDRGLAGRPLLTGILHCAKCARAMSRRKTQQGEFYYCRSRKDGCKNMIRLEIADRIVSDSILAFGHVQHFERRVVSGGGYANEAAEVEPEIRELKVPREPVRVELVPADRTLAQVWQVLDTAGRRRLLLELGYGGKSVFQRGKPRITAEQSRDGTVRVGIEPPELLASIAKLSEQGDHT